MWFGIADSLAFHCQVIQQGYRLCRSHQVQIKNYIPVRVVSGGKGYTDQTNFAISIMSSGEVLKSGWCANKWSNRIKVISRCCILNASAKDNKYGIVGIDDDIPAGSFFIAACTYDEAWWPNYLCHFQVAHSSPSSLRLPLDHELSKTISHCTVGVVSGIEDGKLICSKMISGHYSMNPVVEYK